MNKGSVLVIVMILGAFISMASILMFSSSENTAMISHETYINHQASIYSSSALEKVIELIEEDDTLYTTIDDVWFSIPTIIVERGTVDIIVKSLDDRISLNTLASANPLTRERGEKALVKVFEDNSWDISLIEDFKRWVLPASLSQVGDYFYELGNYTLASPKQKIKTFAQILIFPDAKENYEDYVKLITAGDVEGKININLASSEVIKAFLPELSEFVDEIIYERSIEPFKDKGALYKILGKYNELAYQKALPYFDVVSNLYYLKMRVAIDKHIKYYHVLLRRTAGKIEIDFYAQSTALDYF